MKVLTINCTYQIGSTGKIISELANNLEHNVLFYQCYEAGPESNENRYRVTSPSVQKLYYILARLTGRKHSTGIIPTVLLMRRIIKETPDLVHIHCPYVNTVHIPKLISFLKKKGIPTIITNHAEFFYTGNCPHAYDCLKFQTGCGNCDYVFDPYRKYLFDRTSVEWKLMRKAFLGARNVTMVAVSPWVEARMKLSPITKDLKTLTIMNGINTGIFNTKPVKDKVIDNSIRNQYILHVTASFTDEDNDLKGGRYIIELAKKMLSSQFVVIGPVRLQNNENIPNNIIFIGQIDDQLLLAEYYRKAKLTIIVSRKETYGMVCAESLSCGTPVIGFSAGGPESIAIEGYSEFVEYGSIESLYQITTRWLDKKIDRDKLSDLTQNRYSSNKMTSCYYSLYQKVLSEGK